MAMQNWVGANGTDQDVVYEDDWHEVKSVSTSAMSVTTSSFEQLDCTSNTGALSIKGMVRQISSMLTDYTDALDLFQSKLSSYWYIDLQEYSEQKYFSFSSFGSQQYGVNDTFPRFTKQNAPTQIESLN